MKFIPNAVTTKVARQLLITQKNSPAILFGAGVVGMVTSTVLACRATLKVDAVLDEAQNKLGDIDVVLARKSDNYTDKDAKKDKAYVYIRTAVGVGRLYGPAILCAAASITALAGSQNILNRRNAALGAAYAALDKGFKEYRQRVVDEYGEDKDRELRYGTEERVFHDTKTGKEVKTGAKSVSPSAGHSIYARFFDEFNKNYVTTPEFNFMFLRCQQNYLNDLLHSRGHVFLNEAYDLLGLERTKEGAVVGWVRGNGDDFIDFGVFERNDNERVVDFMTGAEKAILLDFNVDGVIYDKI